MTARDWAWIAVLVVLASALVGAEMSICPLAGLFGIPCPSCGLTRASLEILFGNWRRAFTTHPAAFAVLPYLGAVALASLWPSRRATRLLAIVGLALLAAMTLLWALRLLGHFSGPVQVRPWRAS